MQPSVRDCERETVMALHMAKFVHAMRLGVIFIILHIFLLFKVILMPLIAVKSLGLPSPMCQPSHTNIIMTAMVVISVLLLHVFEHRVFV